MSPDGVRSDPYHGLCWETRESYQWQYEGGTDSGGRWEGQGVLRLEDGGELVGTWRAGARQGTFITSCPDLGIKQLRGQYKNGKLTGRGRITCESYNIEGTFRDGCLHGLARITSSSSSSSSSSLVIGRYLSGVAAGTWWQIFPHGGCLVGEVSEVSGLTISGDNLVYLFPDFITALQGHWLQSNLVKSRQSRVLSVWRENGVCQIRYLNYPTDN